MAHDYIFWLSKKTGRMYRLLSESEWEYAARGGTETEYWFGDKYNRRLAYTRESRIAGNAGALPNHLEPNPFGLLGTLGNIAEWVQDCHSTDIEDMPNDGSPRVENADCLYRVIRGGSFITDGNRATSSARSFGVAADTFNFVGFRVASDEIFENEQ